METEVNTPHLITNWDLNKGYTIFLSPSKFGIVVSPSLNIFQIILFLPEVILNKNIQVKTMCIFFSEMHTFFFLLLKSKSRA